jgi:hypothetical protein
MTGEVKNWQTLPPEDEVEQNRWRLNDPPRKNWWSDVGAVKQSTGADLGVEGSRSLRNQVFTLFALIRHQMPLHL